MNVPTKLLVATAAIAMTAACGEVEYSETTGARQGRSFTLTPAAPQRAFETRICAEFFEPAGDGEIDLAVHANVEHRGRARLNLELVAPGSAGLEVFPIDGMSRVESTRLTAMDDPEIPCRDGVQILFEADESISGPMTVDWEVDYKVAADYDFGFSSAVRIYDLDE
ncbi:MAG: hypothetical protein AAF721_08335 [Myxococcota bacterium]